MQNEADYSVFQREPSATKVYNEEEKCQNLLLLAHRDIEMEIEYEHEVKSSDTRIRVIYPTPVLSEIENFRKRNRGREEDCIMMFSS